MSCLAVNHSMGSIKAFEFIIANFYALVGVKIWLYQTCFFRFFRCFTVSSFWILMMNALWIHHHSCILTLMIELSLFNRCFIIIGLFDICFIWTWLGYPLIFWWPASINMFTFSDDIAAMIFNWSLFNRLISINSFYTLSFLSRILDWLGFSNFTFRISSEKSCLPSGSISDFQ